jgi:hypothetical protein
MTPVASIQRSPDKPGFGIQPILPGLGVTDRPAPLLLEEKGPGDEVNATEKGPGDEVDAMKARLGDDSVSLSVSIEENGSAAAEGDEVHATKERPEDNSLSVSIEYGG